MIKIFAFATAVAIGFASATSAQPVESAPSSPPLAPATQAGAIAPTAPAASQPTGPSVDWPYGKLMADLASRAVLARDVPNITGYEYQDQIQTLTIRQIAHFPQAGIDSAKLDAIQADLAGGSPSAAAVPMH